MDYIDNFHPVELNDYDNNEEIEKRIDIIKKTDRGYNKTSRLVSRNNVLKKSKIEFYVSGDTGSNIRDAETGHYHPNIIGSLDEDLFFKVCLATGECKSKNGSNILFYTSPNQYMSHFNVELKDDVINNWTTKRDARMKSVLHKINSNNSSSVVVH
jgi:hypothetical protein